MILEFKIPHGRMSVDLAEFAAGAGVRNTKRLFRLYAQSDPDRKEIGRIREYLGELAKEQSAISTQAKISYGEADQNTRILEQQFKRAAEMGAGVHSDQLEEWRAVKRGLNERLKAARAECKRLKLEESRSRRRAAAYERTRMIMDEILGEEG